MSDVPTRTNAAASSHSDQSANDAELDEVVLSAARLARRRKKNRDVFNGMRTTLLDDLIRCLDILIYAELSTVYSLDCNVFRLFIRCTIQFMFLTPKPPMFPNPPKPEPFVGAIVGSNLLCLILHIFSQAPSAGEATRFYLHGGLLIDFIGQRGPTSKLLLVALDMLITILQFVHLSAHVSRLRLKDDLPRHSRQRRTQDLDSEERGVRRSAEDVRTQIQESIELQGLNSSGRTTRAANQTADSSLEASSLRVDAVLYDAFRNGQVVLADLDLYATITEQIVNFHKTPPEVRRSAITAQLRGRMLGLRMFSGGTVDN